MSKLPSRQFEIFAGNEVNIITKNSGKKGSVVFSGTLLEECEDNYYLGNISDGIFAAVAKNECMGITLGENATKEYEDFEVQ